MNGIKKEGKPLLSDEEWKKIIKNAYPTPSSTLAVSEERYRLVTKNIRQRGKRSGRPTLADLSDADYKTIIEESEGYLVLSRNLKPNHHL